MYKSKLINLVQSLDESDWKYIRKGVNSNSSDSMKTRLFNYLYKNRSHLTTSVCDIDLIIKSVVSVPTRKALQNVASSLYGDISHILVIREVSQDKKLYNNLLMKVFRDLGLKDLYKAQVDRSLRVIDDSPQDIWNSYWILKTSFDNYYSELQAVGSPTELGPNEIATALEEFSQSIKWIVQISATVGDIIKGESIIETSPITRTQVSNILMNCHKLIDIGCPSAEIKIEQEIFTNNKSSKPLTTVMGLSLLHHYRRQVALGKDNSVKIYKIYRRLELIDALTVNGVISEYRFINCISIGCSIGGDALHWSMAFLNKYEHSLPYHSKVQIVLLSKSEILLAQRQGQKVIQSLSSFSSQDRLMKIKLYHILIRAYYLCYRSEISLLDTYIKNIERFLLRNAENYSERVISGSLNLCKSVRLLAKDGNSKKTRHRIFDFKHIAYKNWVIKELDTLPST